MDALVLSSSHPSPGRGIPLPAARGRGIADDVPATSGATAPRRARERVLRLLGHGGSAPGPETGAGAVVTRRAPLLAYTAASIVLGLGLLMASTVFIELSPAIDPGLPGTTLAGPNGGLLLWLLFGLLGSVRVLRTPDGGHYTFHLPFIGAAMILGGPTAGAWVAFLSTIERRELESQPWYGILANHAVLAIAAVLGGIVASGVARFAGGASGEIAAAPWGAGTLLAAGAGVVVLAAVATAMGTTTVLLRDGLTRSAVVEALLGTVGRVTVLEVGLALLLALAFVEIGWWAPVVIGGFVALVWDNHPLLPDDELTGLRSYQAFSRLMERGLGRMRRGLVDGGTVMFMDLDGFGKLNKDYGTDVGDEVLREVGHRLCAQARRPDDIAGRLKVGDELGMFLPGLRDRATAVRRAEEIHAAICAPILASVGVLSVGVSIGIVVAESRGTLESGPAILRQADQAMRIAKLNGGGVHLYDPAEPTPFETRHEAGPSAR
jgi:diguanylate cyclase (GGDEF)-like protein